MKFSYLKCVAKLVSCADFKAILTTFREVVRNRYSSF